MDPLRAEESLSIDELRDYFSETQSIFHRWLKIQTHEEKNMASALVVDQLVKSLMIKIDQVFTLKNKQIAEIQEFTNEKIKMTKDKCWAQIDSNMKEIALENVDVVKRLAKYSLTSKL